MKSIDEAGRRAVAHGMSALRAGLLACLAAGNWIGASSQALAQDKPGFPSRPITLVVSTSAASSVDIMARLLAKPLSESLKQPVVIENKGGGNGQIAVGLVSQAAPDGHTLLVTTGTTITTNPYLYPSRGEASIAGLTTVTKLINLDFVLSVRPDLKVRTFAELLQLAKSRTEPLTIATSSKGGGPYMMAELLQEATKLRFLVIPHRGGGDALTTVLGGHADLLIDTHMLTSPLAEAGKLIPITASGAARSRFAPNLPTAAELGISGFETSGSILVMAPKGIPDEIAELFSREFRKASQLPEVRSKLNDLKVEPVFNSPKEFAVEWKRELKVWKDLISARGLQME
jgi:tripartite-type tricarboxylate transporter receptor subunit TctC